MTSLDDGLPANPVGTVLVLAGIVTLAALAVPLFVTVKVARWAWERSKR